MKTIAYIMSTYHIGTHNLDIRDILDIENVLNLYHCQILWMGTKRGRPRGNHFQYTLFQFQRR